MYAGKVIGSLICKKVNEKIQIEVRFTEEHILLLEKEV